MQSNQTEIRIYVACLAAYNNGILHGKWIDATEGEGAIWEGINAVLKSSPIEDAEEWAIHDHEGFGGLGIGEYSSVESVVEMAEFMEHHGELGSQLVAYLGDMDSARVALGEHYIGQYETVADFAEELTEQGAPIPDNLRFYIDYDKMARDMKTNDLIVIETGYREQHLFWSF